MGWRLLSHCSRVPTRGCCSVVPALSSSPPLSPLVCCCCLNVCTCTVQWVATRTQPCCSYTTLYDATDAGIQIYLHWIDYMMVQVPGFGTWVTYSFPRNIWVHLTLVWSPSDYKLQVYLSGTLLTDSATSGPILTPGVKQLIGPLQQLASQYLACFDGVDVSQYLNLSATAKRICVAAPIICLLQSSSPFSVAYNRRLTVSIASFVRVQCQRSIDTER